MNINEITKQNFKDTLENLIGQKDGSDQNLRKFMNQIDCAREYLTGWEIIYYQHKYGEKK